LIYFLIAVSGVPFFSGSKLIGISLFLITTILIVVKGVQVDKRAILIILCFLFIEFLQYIWLGGLSYNNFLGTFIKIGIAHNIVILLERNFIVYYVELMYIFSLIALFLYSLSFFPGVTDYFINTVSTYFISPLKESNSFYKVSPNIIIFTFERSLINGFRNSGPFWEPGGYAVFLIIALIFNFIRTSKIIDKKNIIFILSIITTVSTMGYLALICILCGYLVITDGISKKVLFIISLFVISSLYTTAPFMKEKILHNIDVAELTTGSRFGSALVDFRLFKKSPIIGNGKGDMRYGGRKISYFTSLEHRNNGIFILLATYGIIITFLYLFLIYLSFSRLCNYYEIKNRYTYIFFISFLILGFSQSIYLKPFFFCFLFIPLVYPKLNKYNYLNLK